LTRVNRKGTESKLACSAPKCGEKQAKELHDLLTKEPTMVKKLTKRRTA
jgi:hypothetical protein